jgi:hypothetical protein
MHGARHAVEHLLEGEIAPVLGRPAATVGSASSTVANRAAGHEEPQRETAE